MAGNRHHPSEKAGAPPGTLYHTGISRNDPVHISALVYNESDHKEFTDLGPEELATIREEGKIAWINVDGVHKTETVASVCRLFGIHPLVQEDIVNTAQRPKMEDYGDYLYIVMRMARLNGEGEPAIEQVSIVLGRGFILSFQEVPGDVFDPIRSRIRQNQGRVCRMDADFLAYLLLDSVADGYFLILETIGEQIDVLEEEMIDNPEKKTLTRVYALKRIMIDLRKSVWPMREIVTNLQRLETSLMGKEVFIYMRDFSDHIMRVIETVETYRDTLSSMVDLYLSTTSIRMNEVIKVLTVISTIFIPLTFITGFYGMNLDFMPEVHSEWSYPVIVGVMVLMVVLQLIWFRRKGWL